jgi:Phosphoenolpyruvate phosphomutase
MQNAAPSIVVAALCFLQSTDSLSTYRARVFDLVEELDFAGHSILVPQACFTISSAVSPKRLGHFRALHERGGAFINVPNPWDIGTARLLAHLGFEALATTSAGYAFSVGQRDNTVDREEMMTHLGAIAAATDLPVSADLGNGFGDDPMIVAETLALASAAGLVGGSIEDATGRRDHPIYEMEHAVERIRAAALSRMAVHQAQEHARSCRLADGRRDSGKCYVSIVLNIHTFIVDELFVSVKWQSAECGIRQSDQLHKYLALPPQPPVPLDLY